MASYDLLEHQRTVVREMVKVYEETKESEFFASPAYEQGDFVEFGTTPRRRVKSSMETLNVLFKEGLINLRRQIERKGSLSIDIYTGSLKQSAIDAVKNNFTRPMSRPAANVFQGPVGAAHFGQGNIAITTQKIGIDGTEVGRLLKQMRDVIATIPAEQRKDVEDSLGDLESELKQPTPKKSRVKAFLTVLWQGTKEIAEFGSYLAAIAQAYGIDPASLLK